MDPVSITVEDTGDVGIILETTDDGIMVARLTEGGIIAERFHEVQAGLLITRVHGVDVSPGSGKAVVYVQELLGQKKRPLELEFMVPVKRAQQTVVTVRSAGPLGLILHDSALGARVDHVSSGVILREHPHVRIGLVLVKVNDEDVSPASGRTVADIIPILLDSPRPMVLTFIRPGTEDHDDDHHDFVINPIARKVKEADEEELKPAPAQEPSGPTSFVDCRAYVDIKPFAIAQVVYEVGQLGTIVWTLDYSKGVAIVAALGAANVASQLPFGQTTTSVKAYLGANIFTLVVGVACAGVMLNHILNYCEEPDKPDPKWDEDSGTWVTATSVTTQEWSEEDYAYVNVTRYADRECKRDDAVKLYVGISFITDIVLRAVCILRAAVKYRYIASWWETKNASEFQSAQRVQALVRGNQERKRLRANKGIVTKALAGTKFKAEMYRPATPLERKVQLVLKDLWERKSGGKVELRTFHSIRSQASSIHRIFGDLKKAFIQYDLDGNGTIELGEAQAALKDMGAVISDREMEFLFMEAFAPPAAAFEPFKISVKEQHRKRKGGLRMPWETEEDEEGDAELLGPSGAAWPEVTDSPLDIPSGDVDKMVNRKLPNMNESLPDPAELQTWTRECQAAYFDQRRKYWSRWNITELQESCLDRGLWPEGAQRFVKDRLVRYDYARDTLTADEQKHWEPPAVDEQQDEEDDAEEEEEEEEEEGEEEVADPYRPHVGDEVTLRHSAIVGNINNVLRKGVLQPDEIGVVLKEDPDSTTMNFEVKNTTPGSERNGQVGWYQDLTIMRTDPVKDGDDTGPLMTLEEMSWATDTISGEEMKRMLSGGLDLDHFMVMLAVGFLLKIIPGKIRERNRRMFNKYKEAFESAIDAFIQLDEGHGVLVMQGIEVPLTASKAGDMVTVQKLQSLDENKSGFISFTHFLTGFFHWMDPELDDI